MATPEHLTADELIAFQDLLRDLRKPALTKDEAEILKRKAQEQWRADLQRRISEMQKTKQSLQSDKKRGIFQAFKERFGIGKPLEYIENSDNTKVYFHTSIPGTSVIPGESTKLFRDRLKIEDQDLLHNINIVHKGVRSYFSSGGCPAPHYPKRIAVLLRKRKLFAEEVEFLEAFANLFRDGNGPLYGELAERVAKAQAIWDRHRQR